MDVEYKNGFVTIKKAALSQVLVQYGEMYDPYRTVWREQGMFKFWFKAGTQDPAQKLSFVKERGSQYIAPSGEENITFDGVNIVIPYSCFIGSNQIQVEPENFGRILEIFESFMVHTLSGSSTGIHPYDYWVLK